MAEILQDPAKIHGWRSFIPWFLTLAATLTLIAIGSFLLENVAWFKSTALDNRIVMVYDSLYRMHVLHLQVSFVQRSIGLFSGFAVLFLGLGVSFYSIREHVEMGVQAPTLSAKIVTASPGIVAMIIGMSLILFTLTSKDEFPPYQPSNQRSESLVMPKPPL